MIINILHESKDRTLLSLSHVPLPTSFLLQWPWKQEEVSNGETDATSNHHGMLKKGAAFAAEITTLTISNAYSIPDLQYNFDSLEPYIDAPTMTIHHDKYHGTALEATLVHNSGGGYYNHAFFWDVSFSGWVDGCDGGFLVLSFCFGMCFYDSHSYITNCYFHCLLHNIYINTHLCIIAGVGSPQQDK